MKSHKGICYIVGAGECSRLLLHPKQEDMIIAVDGGYEYIKEGQVDLVVGDFDSLGFVPEHSNVIALPPEKDDTDMLFAIKEGLKAGYGTLYIRRHGWADFAYDCQYPVSFLSGRERSKRLSFGRGGSCNPDKG